MTFRGRLLIAMGALAVVPLTVIALGVRQEMTERLTAQYERRVEGLAAVTREDLDRESSSITGRLHAIASSIRDDNRFRAGVVGGAPAERDYVLDYAGRAMNTAGLSMLQIQDGDGRILSSGHFRNEYGRLEPELPALLARFGGSALASARTPEGPMLVLAGLDSLSIGGRPLTIVGGIQVDHGFLRSIARGRELAVTLAAGSQLLSSDSLLERNGALVAGDTALAASGELLVASLNVPFIGTTAAGERSADSARFVITHPTAELLALRRSIDRWFMAAIAITVAVALLLSGWLAGALSRPLSDLATRTKRIDLDRLDASFATDRDDEIGVLSRTLGAMTRRLRSSATSLREAERRATVGDLARQVNHDIKNGLAPIRNVMRHLGQVAEENPSELANVFGERRHTLEASVAYLDNLSRNYARLTPRLDSRPCDVNEVAGEIAAGAPAAPNVAVQTRLASRLPKVAADPLVLRRILENLVSNAVDSLGAKGGSVTIATESTNDGGVRVTVVDTGSGMTREELARAFDDFHTTKQGGTGLGLSIVRRLVTDLHGALRIETEPGVGTTAIVTLDSAVSDAQLPRDDARERSRR
ncbi:MAG TPA: ATP-binding protein [Gemmatimonadaceae bacterium]|nr:ATP-binding protein [Gemmatimonadaceae bacterium]